MPAPVVELADEVSVLRSHVLGVRADQDVAVPGAVQQLVRKPPARPHGAAKIARSL
jgi:hypothetical protein